MRRAIVLPEGGHSVIFQTCLPVFSGADGGTCITPILRMYVHFLQSIVHPVRRDPVNVHLQLYHNANYGEHVNRLRCATGNTAFRKVSRLKLQAQFI